MKLYGMKKTPFPLKKFPKANLQFASFSVEITLKQETFKSVIKLLKRWLRFFPLKQRIREDKTRSEMASPDPGWENTLPVLLLPKDKRWDLCCWTRHDSSNQAAREALSPTAVASAALGRLQAWKKPNGSSRVLHPYGWQPSHANTRSLPSPGPCIL